MKRRLGLAFIASLLLSTLGFVGNAEAVTATTTNVSCTAFNWGHPASPGIYEDPCAHTEYSDVNTRTAQTVEWSWVDDGAGGVKINAVRTVARIQDLSGWASGIQVDWVNVGYFNGGGLVNTCVCPVNSQGNDLLVYTPWKFGVGCGNTATGHWAGDEIWNHAEYSARSAANGIVFYYDSDTNPAYKTRSAPSYYYFAPRSSC